jgi:hypothetical protein
MTRDLNPGPRSRSRNNLEVQGYRDVDACLKYAVWLNSSHSVILHVEVLSPKSRKDPFDAIDGNSCGRKRGKAF